MAELARKEREKHPTPKIYNKVFELNLENVNGIKIQRSDKTEKHEQSSIISISYNPMKKKTR